MGSGNTIKGQGICVGVKLHIHGVWSMEGILAITPLKHRCHPRHQIVDCSGLDSHTLRVAYTKFMEGDTIRTLRGDPESSTLDIEAKTSFKETRQNNVCMELYNLTGIVMMEQEDEGDCGKMIGDKFPNMFETPKGLLLKRVVDHTITLVQEAQPVTMRSYKHSKTHPKG